MNPRLRSFIVSLQRNIIPLIALIVISVAGFFLFRHYNKKETPAVAVASGATNPIPHLAPYFDPFDTNMVAGALIPAVPPSNAAPAAVSAPATTNVVASTLTQADLNAVADLIKAALTNQPPVQVTVTNSPAPAVSPMVASQTTTTNTPDTNRFVRGPQVNKVVVDASWKTSLGDGEYKETRTIEAETVGAQQTVLDVPTVAQLVGALTEAQLAANASAPTATPAKVAGVATPVTPSAGTNPVAQANPTQPDPTTTPTPTTPTELKNPTVLKDGRLVELQGQWLYTKDGKPVFVQEPEPAPRAVPATTRPVVSKPGYVAHEANGRRFYSLAPAPR